LLNDLSCKAAEDGTAWTASDLLSIISVLLRLTSLALQSTRTRSHVMTTPERLARYRDLVGRSDFRTPPAT